jgi:phosphoribosylformimino-5-aminoimidazole carboxamide ribotide isomerase
MIAIPAIDLRGGACVQLVGGSFASEALRIDDPSSALGRWQSAGFTRLHVVDLDAAVGAGDNADQISSLLSTASIPMQVGGGVRTSERVRNLLQQGADRVVLGTRAIEDPSWLEELAADYPDRIVVAADVRDRAVVTHGWANTSTITIRALIDRLNHVPLGGVLVTAVHVEGQLNGPDWTLTADVVRRTAHPVIASGGIASIDDLRRLASEGVSASVIGMALYTGTLDARAVAEEFSE